LDLIGKRDGLQARANELAIEESNLAEQMEQLRAVERRSVEVNREKHRIIGAIQILNQAIQAQESEIKPE
jgi:hypothetical protein